MSFRIPLGRLSALLACICMFTLSALGPVPCGFANTAAPQAEPPEKADSAEPPGEPEAGEPDASAEADGSGGAAEGGDDPAHADPAHADPAHADPAHPAGAHHDNADLGHGNATAQMEAPEQFKSDLAIYTFVVFVLLLLILMKFAWGPIIAGLDKREQSIAGMIEEAQKNAAQSEAKLKQYEDQLAAAAAETKEMLASARQDAEAAKDRIVADAQEAARRERDRAVADINAAKTSALNEVAQQGADIAVQLAGQIVRRELQGDDHAQLIQDALAKFPSKN